MESEKGVYLIDRLENIGALAALGPRFARAVAFLTSTPLGALALGRHELDGANVFANVEDSTLVPPAARKAELHHDYFDIQIPLGTDEVIGLARFDPSAPGTFDASRDIGFYDQRVEPHVVSLGSFALIWPRTGLHAPSCTRTAEHVSRKVVVKVRA